MRFLFFPILLTVLYWALGQSPAPSRADLLPAYEQARKLFRDASRLAADAQQDEIRQARADSLFRLCDRQWERLERAAKPGQLTDTQFFNLYSQRGYIAFYFDSLGAAAGWYRQSLAIADRQPGWQDSLRFLPWLVMGAQYHRLQETDSAQYYYEAAARISTRLGDRLPESQRVYNRLGVLLYENGNYRQAGNYFEKALSLLEAGPAQQSLRVNYLNNLASIRLKLGDYKGAREAYNSLLPGGDYQAELHHNVAITWLKEGDYTASLNWLRKVRYADNPRQAEWFYNLAQAWQGLGNADSSAVYYYRGLAENLRWYGNRPTVTLGLLYKMRADALAETGDWKNALLLYQQALAQLKPGLDSENWTANPDQFSGSYSYIHLFHTLTAKAAALEQAAQLTGDTLYRKGALEAYTAAFSLSDYVQESYDSDEARLFLRSVTYPVHDRPIRVALDLYRLTRRHLYLEKAWEFDQRNKAAVLALNVREQRWKNERAEAIPEIREERRLVQTITRLSLQAAGNRDSLRARELAARLRDAEMELGKLRSQLRENPSWQLEHPESEWMSLSALRRKMDFQTALLSYHLDAEFITIFTVSARQLDVFQVPADARYRTALDNLREQLLNGNSDKGYSGTPHARLLYDRLLGPAARILKTARRLIIIPDDELHYLPFEALQDESGKYLVEKLAVTYQYNASLLQPVRKSWPTRSVLAMAPFAGQDYRDPAGQYFSRLPYTNTEFSGGKVKRLVDTAATRAQLVTYANQYPVLHLATHASVNNRDPGLSFIQLAPLSTAGRLYAREIANLQLDSTQLIILSACETATGGLVRGEGLLSLSRAFAYAGCPNLVATLWKAEDLPTSFLMRQLHRYLREGYNKDIALQLAKKDLLASNEIPPRFKSPASWSHVVLIGTYEADFKTRQWWWIALVILAAAILYTLIRKKSLFPGEQA